MFTFLCCSVNLGKSEGGLLDGMQSDISKEVAGQVSLCS